MDAHEVLRDMIHSYGVTYGGALDKREQDALRAALTPWISWMVRPHFQPVLEEQLASDSDRRGGWAVTETELIPPLGFSGGFPDWAYDLTSANGPFIAYGGLHFWRGFDGTHSRPAQ